MICDLAVLDNVRVRSLVSLWKEEVGGREGEESCAFVVKASGDRRIDNSSNMLSSNVVSAKSYCGCKDCIEGGWAFSCVAGLDRLEILPNPSLEFLDVHVGDELSTLAALFATPDCEEEVRIDGLQLADCSRFYLRLA